MLKKKKSSPIGKRVIHLSSVKMRLAVYGTVDSVEKYGGIEYWQVSTPEIHLDGQSTNFAVWEYEEFHPGDKIKYMVDRGGYWEGVVLYPHLSPGPDLQVYFCIQITDVEQAAVKAPIGHQISLPPSRLHRK